MSVAFRAASAGVVAAGSAGQIVLTMPAGAVVGDIAIASIVLNNTFTASAPAGWTQVTGSPLSAGPIKLQVFYKVLAAGDPGNTFTFTQNGTSNDMQGGISVYHGQSASPIGTSVTGTDTAGTHTSFAGPSATLTTGGLLVTCWSAGAQNINPTFTLPNNSRVKANDSGTASMTGISDVSGSGSTASGTATTSAAEDWGAIAIPLIAGGPAAVAGLLDFLGCLNSLAGTTNAGAAAAACIYAGIPVGSMDTLGALNIKAGNGSAPSGWVGLNAVCNQLAGTSGLEALEALHVLLQMPAD